MIKKSGSSYRFGLIALALLCFGSLGARNGLFDRFSPWDKEFYLSDEQLAFIRPGLDLQVSSVTVNEERRLVVEFSIADPEGLPLDINGVFTPGQVSVRFLIAYLPDDSGYLNYITRSVTSPITGLTAEQPTSDSGGSFEQLGDGIYLYTFGNQLPEDFDQNATHTLGVYATRDLREFGLDRDVANEAVNFVPSGNDLTLTREVVLTENCNECHNPLAFHGGSRKDVRLCVLCHTSQNFDPDTGNSVEFKVMIHKIHRGEELPSVQAGTPYQIIGNRGSVFDFSEIAFPQDIRNCTKCHKGAAQGGNWALVPTGKVCGACHDQVDFATGENHAGGPQISDRFCSNCHFPEGELEFDASIRGAHTVPYKSRQLAGLNIDVLSVSNGGPGQTPVILFQIRNDDGTEVAPEDLDFFNFTVAGPTSDYSTLIRESARVDSVPSDSGYTYTLTTPIPSDASGTFAVGAEGYRMVKLNAGTVKERDFRETAENPVVYFAVTDAEPVPRRVVVEDQKCERCHDNLALHGTIRHDPQYCVTCHIPGGTDEAQRPPEEAPVQSRHFKFLIHRIHRGHDLTREFTIYGFGGRPHNYNELHFPGDLRDCETCHVDDSYNIPLPEGVLVTDAPREFFNPLTPVSSACLACHDTLDAAAHAFTMIAPFGEACASCHGEEAEFAVEMVHAR